MSAWTDVWDSWKLHVDILEDLRAHCDATQAAQFTALENALTGAYLPSGGARWVQGVVGGLSNLLSPANYYAMAVHHALQLGQVIDSPFGADQMPLLLRDIRDYMIAQSPDETVETRNITYTSWAAGGSNTGTGAMKRLTVDEQGTNLESVTIELHTAKCIADGNMDRAQRHAERFRLYGVDPSGRGYIALNGSGAQASVEVVALHCGSGEGGSLLNNASFETLSGTGTDKFTGWTVGTAGNVEPYSSSTYRGYPGQPTTLYALRFTASDTMTQKISNPGTRLKRHVPYYGQIAWQRLASATGTLKFRIGTAEVTVDISTGTNGVWNVLAFTPGQNTSWYKNLVEDDLAIDIEANTLATGTVLVDDVIFQEMKPFDGTYHAVIGGATPFRIDDSFTHADTGGAVGDGKINYSMYRAGLPSFPSTAAATPPTITDP